MPVKWVKLASVAEQLNDVPLMCCRCETFDQFEDMWTTIPFSEQGKRMMQGYIHCGSCKANTAPAVAWQQAHQREYGH